MANPAQKIDEFLATTSFVAGDVMYGLRGGTTDLSIDILECLAAYVPNTIGAIRPFPTKIVPARHLYANGAAISRATYSELFNVLCRTVGTGTVTIASPGVWTLVAHGLETGDQLYLTTTGALPTGLAANTLYYAIYVTADTFRLATSRANALAGTAINTSGTQSGVHTVVDCPWGLGDGSTTFNIPDFRESVPYGYGTRGSGVTAHDTVNVGQFVDDRVHNHRHSATLDYDNAATGVNGYARLGNTLVGQSTTAVTVGNLIANGGDGTPRTGNTTRTKQVGVNFCIQYE